MFSPKNLVHALNNPTLQYIKNVKRARPIHAVSVSVAKVLQGFLTEQPECYSMSEIGLQ